MRSAVIFCTILFLASGFLTGCETTKGLAKGVASTATLTSRGTIKDSENFYHTVLKVDKWIRENLW